MPRVLVVDDDPMVSVAIEVCLQRQGMEITIGDGGEAGMRELASGAHDVTIVDSFMPPVPGFQSIRVFRESAPQIPLIAMPGFANAGTSSPGLLRMTPEPGAACCLRKPFTPKAPPAAVTDCLQKPMVSTQFREK